MPPAPTMPRPDRETVIVGVTVRRADVPAALAALPPGDVLVAVRVPRADLPTAVHAGMLSRLGAIGELYTHSERRDVPVDEFLCDVDTVS